MYSRALTDHTSCIIYHFTIVAISSTFQNFPIMNSTSPGKKEKLFHHYLFTSDAGRCSLKVARLVAFPIPKIETSYATVLDSE